MEVLRFIGRAAVVVATVFALIIPFCAIVYATFAEVVIEAIEMRKAKKADPAKVDATMKRYAERYGA